MKLTKKEPDEMRTFSIYAPVRVMKEYEMLSYRVKRSRNELINQALEEFLKNVEIEEEE